MKTIVWSFVACLPLAIVTPWFMAPWWVWMIVAFSGKSLADILQAPVVEDPKTYFVKWEFNYAQIEEALDAMDPRFVRDYTRIHELSDYHVGTHLLAYFRLFDPMDPNLKTWRWNYDDFAIEAIFIHHPLNESDIECHVEKRNLLGT